MLNLPHSTEVNRNISKNKFYEKWADLKKWTYYNINERR